jgi:hypothetical protein
MYEKKTFWKNANERNTRLENIRFYKKVNLQLLKNYMFCIHW